MAIRRSRWITLVSLTTALAVILNRFSVPAPYEAFLLYGVWEVPVLFALLVLGFRGGTTVAILNAIALEFVNPGGLPTGPLYNLIAEVSMFLGVLAVQSFAGRKEWGRIPLVALATAVAAASRTAVMTVVNWLVLPRPFPVGFSIPQAALPEFLLLIGVFNFTVVLYTVPAAYGVKEAVISRYPSLELQPRQVFTP